MNGIGREMDTMQNVTKCCGRKLHLVIVFMFNTAQGATKLFSVDAHEWQAWTDFAHYVRPLIRANNICSAMSHLLCTWHHRQNFSPMPNPAVKLLLTNSNEWPCHRVLLLKITGSYSKINVVHTQSILMEIGEGEILGLMIDIRCAWLPGIHLEGKAYQLYNCN